MPLMLSSRCDPARAAAACDSFDKDFTDLPITKIGAIARGISAIVSRLNFKLVKNNKHKPPTKNSELRNKNEAVLLMVS